MQSIAYGADRRRNGAPSNNPDHKSVHEYAGELWLTLGDLGRLDRQLAALDRICRFGREEFDELVAEIAASKS